MGWEFHDGMGWWMVWGSAFWLFTLVVIGFAFASLFGGRSSGGRSDPGRGETPREIVERRYARGEIDRDEFLRLIADLEGRH